MNQYLPEGLIVLHNRFDEDRIPHAFGGAIALAYSAVARARRRRVRRAGVRGSAQQPAAQPRAWDATAG